MTPSTVTLAAAAAFVVLVLSGMVFGIAESPPGSVEPIGVRVCFALAVLCVVVMFGATVVEIAVHVFTP